MALNRRLGKVRPDVRNAPSLLKLPRRHLVYLLRHIYKSVLRLFNFTAEGEGGQVSEHNDRAVRE